MPRGLKNGNGNGGRRNGRKMRGKQSVRRPRTSAAQPVVQGVGQAALVPFGSRKMGSAVDALNALHPRHLALPRPIAPYIVVRNTGIFTLSNTSSLTIWGCTRTRAEPSAYGQRAWSNVAGIGSVDINSDITSSNNANKYMLPMGQAAGWGTGASIVPSAFTIQIMNPEALQSTDGIVYIGRMTNRGLVNEVQLPWAALANTLVAYQAPRQCSAAKLAFRGVQVDAVPADMSALANFTNTTNTSIPGGNQSGVPFTWDGLRSGQQDEDFEFEGFLPIFIYNPDGVALRIQVTVEYRYRFDPFSPATSAHRYYPPASLSIWDSTIRAMQSIGHGVKDIADVVATAGSAYQTLRGGIGQGASVPMLVD